MTDDRRPPEPEPEIVVSDSQDNPTPTDELGRLIEAEDSRPEPDNEDG